MRPETIARPYFPDNVSATRYWENGGASEENGARQERGDKIIEATMKQGLPAFCLCSIKIPTLKERREREAWNHASGNEKSSVDRCSTSCLK